MTQMERTQTERTLNVVIAGATGRMGRTLIEAVLRAPQMRLHGALDRPDSPLLGRDAGESLGAPTGVKVGADIGAALDGAHVLIDFTVPHATLAHLAQCRTRGVSMVVGTTGFEPGERAQLVAAGASLPMVVAPNMSVGVNVAFKLVETAARILGDAFDVEVFEIHHKHKIDAPSGTAARLGEVAAAALGRDLARDAVYGREGVTGERTAREIGFHSARGGDIVGDHTVFFAGAGERLEITHRSSSRANYALGALRAARWLDGRAPGLYDMQDVLGLRA
jgi:4-hydroxy-tetrahydrodipicolinate reductase